MYIKKFLRNNWRFHIFKIDNNFFIFDCFSHKIFTIKYELYKLLNTNNYKLIKTKYKKFYTSVLKQNAFTPILPQNKKCNVTINFSNKCNLNCSYCYRCKKLSESLSKENLKAIMNYVTKVYNPNASEYVFSLCYTSESSLELEKLKYFDYLIGENEGYLFKNNQVSNKTVTKILKRMPNEIQNKYKSYNNSIEKLNEILKNESLWDYYNYTDNEYLVKILEKNNILSYSRRIMANRQILNKTFSDFNIERTIHYFSMSFMTNGTNITDEYIDFIKSILLDTIYVSIDGPSFIQNKNRPYHNKEGTFEDVIKGVSKLKENGINVVASVVITPAYPKLDQIVSFLISKGFDKISFNLVRGNTKLTTFTFESIRILLDSIRYLFDKFYTEFSNGKTSKELIAVKNTMLFSALKNLYYRNYVTSRCTWGKEIIIDPKGDIYHCNSTIGYKNDLLGNYKDNKNRKYLLTVPDVNNSEHCKKCYAKYLCGGTCYAEIIYGNTKNGSIECYYRKELINENLKLYAKLYKNSLLDEFIKAIN